MAEIMEKSPFIEETLSKLIDSSAFWGASGVIIGAIIGGAITYIVAKQSQKIELKKQKADFLLYLLTNINSAYSELMYVYSLKSKFKCEKERATLLFNFSTQNFYLISEEGIEKITNLQDDLILKSRNKDELTLTQSIDSLYSALIKYLYDSRKQIYAELKELHDKK